MKNNFLICKRWILDISTKTRVITLASDELMTTSMVRDIKKRSNVVTLFVGQYIIKESCEDISYKLFKADTSIN